LPTNEDGEYELILRDRQLLGVFAILVILPGLFLTFGYIVGRHSRLAAVADVNPTSKRETKPPVESPAPRPAEPAPAEPQPRKSASPAPTTTGQQQPAETPKPQKNKTVNSEPVKSVKAEKAEREEAAKSASATGGAPSGTYLQLAARTKGEADIMVNALRQKKFAVITAEVPGKPGLFRVLVGPLAEAQVSKTKTDLQSAGFPGDRSIKRSF